LAALLWPALAIIVFFSAKDKIYSFLGRDNLSIKVGGMEISVADATKSLGADVSDLQKRVSEIETRLAPIAAHLGTVLVGATVSPAPAPSKTAGKTNPSLFSILWVDDYPSNNAFLIDQLQKDGAEVKLALSTVEGLKYFENSTFNMIITDLGRQENGRDNPFAGLDLIKQIRALDSNVPILVYAGFRGLQNQGKLIKTGATKVTQSAVEVQSFINKVRGQLPPTG
jgi:CheY-like chemotaxis protein